MTHIHRTCWCSLLAAIQLCVTFPAWGQTFEGLPGSLLQELKKPSRLSQGRYSEVRTWEAEGPEAGHKSGRRVPDAQASGGYAWEARLGRDTTADMFLFGPYLDTPPGDYVAFFRIKLMEPAGEEKVGDIDAAADYAQNILRTSELTGTQLVLDK